MSEPRLIVVTGVPVNSREEITFKWIFTLFLANLTYFIYQCSVYNDKNQILAVFLSFVICGMCFPFYGYSAVKKNKTGAIRFFSMMLAIMSLFGFVSAASSIGFYFEFGDMCEDCKEVFQNGNKDCNVSYVKNEVLYITDDQCSRMPSESTFVIEHVLKLVVNIIGMITACTVTAKRKHAQIAETVPTLLSTDTPVSIITVDGLPHVCAEDR